jgi:hypothetical protein
MDLSSTVKFSSAYLTTECADDSLATSTLEAHYPDAKKDTKFFSLLCSNIDLHMRGIADCVEVPAEEVPSVKDPMNPMATFEFDGAVMKMITARWENGGKKEIWLAEMEPGFYAEWDDYPVIQDLFYVTEGKIMFKVYDTEFIAEKDCLVKIPKYDHVA